MLAHDSRAFCDKVPCHYSNFPFIFEKIVEFPSKIRTKAGHLLILLEKSYLNHFCIRLNLWRGKKSFKNTLIRTIPTCYLIFSGKPSNNKFKFKKITIVLPPTWIQKKVVKALQKKKFVYSAWSIINFCFPKAQPSYTFIKIVWQPTNKKGQSHSLMFLYFLYYSCVFFVCERKRNCRFVTSSQCMTAFCIKMIKICLTNKNIFT